MSEKQPLKHRRLDCLGMPYVAWPHKTLLFLKQALRIVPNTGVRSSSPMLNFRDALISF